MVDDNRYFFILIESSIVVGSYSKKNDLKYLRID